MTGEVVNLRRERKRRARSDAGRQADLNRVAFGRSKAERSLTEAERALAARRIDGHLLREVDAAPPRDPAADA